MSDVMPDSDKLDLVRDALHETQATVRSYDTKAQIVGVGYAFALGIVANTNRWFPQAQEGSQFIAVIVFWLGIMAPLLLFGYVLYPTRKTAPKLMQSVPSDLEHVLYIDPKLHKDIAGLEESLKKCVPIDEYTYELLRVSSLRELKRERFIRALIMAGVAFVLMATSQIIASIM